MGGFTHHVPGAIIGQRFSKMAIPRYLKSSSVIVIVTDTRLCWRIYTVPLTLL